MATKIEWTDETWNPLRAKRKSDGKVGWHCELASPGCVNCYAQTFNGRELPNGGTGLPYTRSSREAVETFLNREVLQQPLHWKKSRRIFVCSMTDLFGEWVTDEQIDQVFAVMNACHLTLPACAVSTRWHTFQVLTKRAERLRRYMLDRAPGNFRQGKHPLLAAGRGEGGPLRGQGVDVMNAGAVLSWPPGNVDLGVSAENELWADHRISELIATPASRRFVSAEPLLQQIDLKIPCSECHWLNRLDVDHCRACRQKLPSLGIDWLIIGGESGPGARICDLRWIRSLVAQCRFAGVAPYVKQLGSNPVDKGRPIKLNHPKGGDPAEWPEDLRVREFPGGSDA